MTSLDAGGTAASGGIRFFGNRRVYWRLLIHGAALRMVTLAIYRFWLTTDVGRFLWSSTEVVGETVEYTGTPLEMLAKIGGATELGMKILLDYPETKARIAAINRIAGARPTPPFLDAAEWAALKRICVG